MRSIGLLKINFTFDQKLQTVKLYRVILPVGNIDGAEKFYSTVLGMPGERISPGRHYFDLGGTILACYDPKADGDDDNPTWKPHFNQYIYVSVDSLENILKIMRTLDAVYIDKEIKTMPWGERMFYANDPWGNPICFVDSKTLFTGDN